ncbi:MAG: hypothetical protein KC593_09015 [Myxococcales bacterium]|nr:hypothetical protein [Myxococcales bacterium]
MHTLRSYFRGVAALTLVALPLLATPVAEARRRPDGELVFRTRRAADLGGGRVARLRTALAMQPEQSGAWLELPDDVVLPVHQGSSLSATIAEGHGALLVAVALEGQGGRSRFFAHRVDPTAAPAALGRAHDITRPSAPPGTPFGVAATATPDGFTVFFQELDASDQSLARTFMAQLAPDGSPRGPSVEVPVPWGVSAATWNGAGYHLALNYPSGEGVRLSMVSVDPSGRPQQHPDWASAAGTVMDVHLVAEGGRVLAYFRGGATGQDLLEADVTRIRQWGQEPPAPRRVSRLDWDQLIVVTRRPDGARARAVR